MEITTQAETDETFALFISIKFTIEKSIFFLQLKRNSKVYIFNQFIESSGNEDIVRFY